MKLRFVLPVLAVFTLALALPALAQDAPTDSLSGGNTITYDGFSFTYPRELGGTIQVSEIPGDMVDLQVPGGPRPPQVVFSIFDAFPDGGAEFGPNVIRVFTTTDLQQYELANTELANLQNLLATDVDLVDYTQIDDQGMPQVLPYLASTNAAQVLTGLPEYVEANGMRGIAYVTAYRQDVYPFLADSFLYTFQGVTDDGQYAVSASFNVTTDLFEAEVPEDFDYEAFSADYIPYLNESRTALNSAAPSDFTPSLDVLDQVIASFTFTGDSMGAGIVDEGDSEIEGGAQTAPDATAEPTAIVDASFGGLGNITWTLIDYGDPAALTSRLPETEVIVSFSERGINGNAGCNTFGGEFNYVNNATLTVGSLITTRMACEEAVNQQETAFLSALQSVTGYAIDDSGQLILFYTENDVQKQLNFRSAEALAATPETTPDASIDATPEVTPSA